MLFGEYCLAKVISVYQLFEKASNALAFFISEKFRHFFDDSNIFRSCSSIL